MTIDTTKITPEKLAEMNDSLMVDNNHLRQQLAANNPLLDEAANELDRQEAEIESLRQQLADSQKQVTLLRSYLEAIIDPVSYIQAKLEDGERINGQMAIRLSESHHYLKGLAKEAVVATEPRA